MLMHEYVDIYVLGIVRYLIIYYRAGRPLGAVYILNKRAECTKTCRSTCSHMWIQIPFNVTTTWNTWMRCRSVVQVQPRSKTDIYV